MHLLFLFFLITLSTSAPSKNKIQNLPGLTFTPTFTQYSGYITINEQTNKNLFYWFVESETSPSTAPLIIWFQGGPGCSSLLGLLTENGPFLINDDGSVRENIYAWNKVANVLFVESPAGVGFSYSDSVEDYTTGDNRTMEDSYVFLKGWFEVFPEFSDRTREVYVSGESYGGHYVPQLVWTIMNKGDIDIDGFFVGNAWTDDVIDTNSIPPFIYNHALCSLETYRDVVKACNLEGEKSLLKNIHYAENQRKIRGQTPECDAAFNKMMQEVGDDINQYDVYAPCIQNGGGLDCTNYTKEINYLNNKIVQNALHVRPGLPKWEVCTSRLNYNQSWSSVVPIYPELIEKYRVMIYAGDVTFNVPFQGSQVWIASLGKPIINRWTSWKVDGQVGGYIEKYERINFVTVRNAGHMVPEYQPKRAFEMFKRYLDGTF